jgi:hypothetical protein
MGRSVQQLSDKPITFRQQAGTTHGTRHTVDFDEHNNCESATEDEGVLYGDNAPIDWANQSDDEEDDEEDEGTGDLNVDGNTEDDGAGEHTSGDGETDDDEANNGTAHTAPNDAVGTERATIVQHQSLRRTVECIGREGSCSSRHAVRGTPRLVV